MKLSARGMALAILFVLLIPKAVLASELSGLVLSAGGDPVDKARVTIVDLRRETTTDADGRFIFVDIPAGDYLVDVRSLEFGGAIQRIEIGDAPVEATFELDQRIHVGAISVTASGRARGLDEVVAPIDVLTDDELALRVQPTLGDTLSEQPGVASANYGQGASRPVIRGLSSERVRVLENGLDSGDVSSIGPDHQTTIDPLSAERIEVVRGPATLLFGGTAIGGVVNVTDGRIPDRVPDKPVTGTVSLRGSTNNNDLAGSVSLDGGKGNFAWHFEAFARDADDYESPAPRPVEEDEHHDHEGEHEEEDEHHDHEGEHEEEFETGRVENTFIEARGGALGLSWIGDRGYIGVSYSLYDSEFGIPGHHHHHEEEHEDGMRRAAMVTDDHDHDHEEEEAGAASNLEQHKVDLHGRYDRPFKGVEALQLRIGYRDYEHVEAAGDEPGTRFANEFSEVRVEALTSPIRGFEGMVGLHYLNRDFSAIGEEAFVQPNKTERVALFLYQEMPAAPWGVQFGLRAENQSTKSVDPTLPSRDFSPFSASVGATYAFTDAVGLNLTVNHSQRAPAAEELYANGPHLATTTFEIGDPDLDLETGNGADLTLRLAGDRVSGWASVYLTEFSDFIYLAETGLEEDELPVFQFMAADARVAGFELHGDFEVLHSANHHIHIEGTYDRVSGELTDVDERLPRIPPQRFRLGLVYQGGRWHGRIEGRWVDEQDRVAQFEESTPDYTMLNAAVGYHFLAGGIAHHILLRGTNLTDEVAYNHVSFIKYQAPIPGRMVTLSYRAVF